MRVSVLQMTPGAEKARNIAEARRLIEEAVAADRPDLVALPEMWSHLGGDRAGKFADAETLPPPGGNQAGGAAYEFLRDAARANGMIVHGGSIAERAGDRLFNTSLVFSPEGREIARYRKIHLFDTVTPDGQGFRESETYGAGEEIVTVQANGVRLGLAICYDMRFPELFLALRRAGADLVMLPSAFTLQTGKDHWEVLLRARAIETQCFIAAPACTGRFFDAKGEARHNYGHSMIVDPWGHVIARASDGPGFASGRIDCAQIARVRADMPVLGHRKLA